MVALKSILTKDIKWTSLEKIITKNVKDITLNDKINDNLVKIKRHMINYYCHFYKN